MAVISLTDHYIPAEAFNRSTVGVCISVSLVYVCTCVCVGRWVGHGCVTGGLAKLSDSGYDKL